MILIGDDPPLPSDFLAASPRPVETSADNLKLQWGRTLWQQPARGPWLGAPSLLPAATLPPVAPFSVPALPARQ